MTRRPERRGLWARETGLNQDTLQHYPDLLFRR